MSKHHQVSININLAGITGRIQRHLRASMSLVAIGLNAARNISTDDVLLPDQTMNLQFESSNPWTVEQAGTAWQSWVLRNGFRDAAEAVSGILEEAQAVLAYWELITIQRTRQILGEDWNELVASRSSRFHRLGLPDKIDFLRKNYSLVFNETLVLTQARSTSIIATKSSKCLVF